MKVRVANNQVYQIDLDANSFADVSIRSALGTSTTPPADAAAELLASWQAVKEFRKFEHQEYVGLLNTVSHSATVAIGAETLGNMLETGLGTTINYMATGSLGGGATIASLGQSVASIASTHGTMSTGVAIGRELMQQSIDRMSEYEESRDRILRIISSGGVVDLTTIRTAHQELLDGIRLGNGGSQMVTAATATCTTDCSFWRNLGRSALRKALIYSEPLK